MAKRLVGHDLYIFRMDENATPTTNYLGMIRSFEVSISYDTQENRALKDFDHYGVVTGRDWTITFDLQLNDALYPTFLGFLPDEDATPTLYVKSQNVAGTVGTSPGVIVMTAQGYVSEVRHRVDEGPQVLSVTMKPHGALTLANSGAVA